VGKAKNLRRRVLSYFRARANHAPKVRSMVHTVEDLEWMVVKNEAEALLTEASLIKKYKPRFNILMRDDKRYLALRADLSEDFPRFTTCRIVRDDGALYFGPFPSAPVVRAAKDFCEKRWGIRGCDSLSPDEEAHRHCHADVIRSCSAPCLGKISREDYRARFDEACAFLRGERPGEFAALDEKMREAAEAGDFETLADLSHADASPVAKVLSAACEQRLPGRHLDLPALRQSMEEEGARQVSRLWGRAQYLMDVGTIAPMVGLLGTVWGMLDAFAEMGAAGSANLATIAPSISAALVTTVVGLLIAIPGVIAFNRMNATIRNITSDMEGFADELIGRIACEFQGRGA
jgi:biopolymer transport protein ExbB/TolQ